MNRTRDSPSLWANMRTFSFPSNLLFIISCYPDPCKVIVLRSPLCWKSRKTTIEQWKLYDMASWRPHTILRGFFMIDTCEMYAVETSEVPPSTQPFSNEQDITSHRFRDRSYLGMRLWVFVSQAQKEQTLFGSDA